MITSEMKEYLDEQISQVARSGMGIGGKIIITIPVMMGKHISPKKVFYRYQAGKWTIDDFPDEMTTEQLASNEQRYLAYIKFL